jgi:hypothetical protein
MKQNKFSQNQNQNQTLTNAPRPLPTPESNQSAVEFAPPADEVARRAYFIYENQGSRSGHEVEHWVAAEAELLDERNLSRDYGFQNRM